ncbi:MAG TPA: beta-propeller fold lactonase family protein [Ginsengibacter sp.]
MKKFNFLKTSMVVAIAFTIGSCNKKTDTNLTQPANPTSVTEAMMSENGANPDEVAITENSAAINSELNSSTGLGSGHFLYTESNNSGSNEILIYKIKNNGTLEWKGSEVSGGAGSGAGLGSQGALVIDKNHNWLYAVNAGGNSVSSFKINNDGSLTLAHTANSGGTGPNSVSVYGNLLYVLNHGSDNIHGLKIGAGGSLTAIAGSSQALSSTAVDAPQISFTPDGNWIVVTEKVTNIISTFKVKNNGSVSAGIFTPSVGQTPFGFDFSRDRYMIVSNAVGGAAGAGSSTSYVVGNNGKPRDVNGAIPDHQAAPCWFATTKYGRFAYTTNTATNNVSSYYVAPWGGLYLVESEAAKTDAGPLDIVVAANNYFVYELNSKSNTIGSYHRKFFGGLELINNTPGLPAPATGLATF